MAAQRVDSILVQMRERTFQMSRLSTCCKETVPCSGEPEFIIVKLPERGSAHKGKRVRYQAKPCFKKRRGRKPKHQKRRRRYIGLGRVAAGE